MRKKVLMILLFSLLFFIHSIETDAAFKFYVGDREVSSATSLMVVNSYILIPVEVLEEYLAAEVECDLDAGKIAITFPTITINMQVGEAKVLVNGVEQIMDVAPHDIDGHIMVPLRFFADLLGLRIIYDNKIPALILGLTDVVADWIAAGSEDASGIQLPDFLDPNQSQTLGTPVLKDIVFMGGPRSRVFIDIEGYVAYESFLLTNPDRMVIDLKGVELAQSLPVQEINDVIVQRIRCDRFDAKTIRIVFDLNKTTNYEINRWPDGGLEVEFNYQIGAIGYYRDAEQRPRIWFEANEQPTFQYQPLPSPMRLIIDFQDSTLLGGARELQVKDHPLRGIRINQNTPSVTRMVLDLDGPMIPVAVEEVNGRYEIIFFEGTQEEYEAKLALEQPQVTIPEVPTPGDRMISGDKPLTGRVIVVDPGHGGSDPGTISSFRGVFEKEIVLAIGLKFGQLLEDAGAIVFYTRNDDRYISLFDRAKLAEMVNADLLISIHANSYEGVAARGIETLYNPLYLDNFRLAQSIQSELIAQVGAVNRGVRPRTELVVLNNVSMPAVLVEIGFLSHQEEEALLIDSEYQQQIAIGLLNGVIIFFAQYR